nr:galactose oxidase-like domain-containing protein [Streptomyces luteolifulvus]
MGQLNRDRRRSGPGREGGHRGGIRERRGNDSAAAALRAPSGPPLPLPSLSRPGRPDLAFGGRAEVEHGGRVVLRTTDPIRISRVRLILPGSATHLANFDQRSVALDIIRRTDSAVTARVPDDASPSHPAGTWPPPSTRGGPPQ